MLRLHKGSVHTFDQYINLIHPALAPSVGRKYIITANLVESAIQVVQGGTQWARSNLWYDASAADGNKYRFRVSPHFRMFNSIVADN